MRKRAIGAIVLLLLVGCAKPKPPEPEPAPVPAKEMTMFLQHGAPSALRTVVRDFERIYPHIDIQVKEQERTASVRDEELDGFDMIYGPSGRASLRYAAGKLLDLSALAMPAWDPLVGELIETDAHIEGKRIWLPLAVDFSMFHLRGVDFAANNIPIPASDWTYTDFEATLQELRDAGAGDELFQMFSIRQAVLHAFGGGDYDLVAGRWRFNTPENQQAYAYLRRLVEKRLISAEYAGKPHPGEAAIRFSPWDYTPGSDNHLLPWPVGTAGRRTPIHTSGLMVRQDIAHREEVIAFLQFLLTPEVQAEFASDGRRPIIDDKDVLEQWRAEVGDERATLMEESLAGGFVVSIPSGADYAAELMHMMKGEAPIAETLAELDQRLNN